MRIPTGNFGNAVPNPQPTRVNVSGTGSIGQAVAGLADDVKQEVNAVVRARAGESMLDYQIKLKDVNESIRQQVEDGTLRADQVEDVYHEAVGKLEKPQFAGLGIAETQVAEGGLKRYESDGLTTAQGYARAALKIEARDQVDSGLDKLGKLANYPDADIEKLNNMSSAYAEQGRIAYGAQWAKVRQNWIDKNWLNQAQQKLMEARNNGGALSDFSNQLTSEKGFYIDKLDPDKRNALLNQAMNYQITLENRARAAEAKREALAARTYNSFAQQVYSDLPTTAEQQERLIASTRGTSVEAEVKDLLSDQDTIRKVISSGPAESQNYVNNLYAELNANGGDMRQWRLAQRLTTAVQKNNKQLMETPLLFNQNRTGDAVTPIDMTALNPTAAAAMSAMEGADITQKFGASITDRSATIDAVRSNTGVNVPRRLLLPQEASYLSGELKKQSVEGQAGLLSRLRNAVNNDTDYQSIMQQIAPDSPITAYAGSLAVTDTPLTVESNYFSDDVTVTGQQVAQRLLTGNQILNPSKEQRNEDGSPKNFPVPPQKEFTAAIADKLDNVFANMPQAYQQSDQAIRSYYVARAAEKGLITGVVDQGILDESIKAVIGTVVNVNGQKTIAPWGMSELSFKTASKRAFSDAITSQGLPAAALDKFDSMGMQYVGKDQYLMIYGKSPLLDPSGKKVIINLSGAGQ
ncbi:hypothetical protein H2Y57_05235 [Pectobacterium aroidearum]|uniref:Internal virion protein C n=2 Tax=Pectobacterium aroidearum TaxID=1201031 RepID=A0AAW3STZ2_9GAMM|nr:hypothetical protein [Pectobacterium aroidearum]MBA5203090.1 hypothetical protein [Pectobacterium aroidearum]